MEIGVERMSRGAAVLGEVQGHHLDGGILPLADLRSTGRRRCGFWPRRGGGPQGGGFRLLRTLDGRRRAAGRPGLFRLQGPPTGSVQLPGRDQLLGTADDITQTLANFTRQIQITDVETDLRSITVTIVYKSGPGTRTYTLTAYISDFA